MKRSFLPVAVAILSAAAVSLAFTAARQAPQPALVAVLDLQKILDGLNEKKTREGELEGKVNELKKRLDELEAQIKSKETAYDMLPESPQKRIAREELEKLYFQRQGELTSSQFILTNRQAELLRELYVKISESAGSFAKQNGYTMVIVNDEAAQVPPRNIDKIREAIALKRVLYVDTRHDITNDLIAFMNNAYAAQGAGGAAARPANSGGAPAPAGRR